MSNFTKTSRRDYHKKANRLTLGLFVTFLSLLGVGCSPDKKKENNQESANATPSAPIKHFSVILPPLKTLQELGIDTGSDLEAIVIGQRNRPKCSFETFEKRFPYKADQVVKVDLDSICSISVFLAVGEKGAPVSFGKENIDFEKHVMPIIKANCTSCHSSKSEKTTDSLETYGEIYPRRQSIKNHVIRGTMPLPPQTMHPSDIAMIKQWVDGNENPAERPFIASKRVFLTDESFFEAETILESFDFKLIE